MTNATLPRLLLSGFMGTGKTTVGRALAEREGATFVDLDEHIVKITGRSVAALFAEEGEAAFRALESRELLRALELPPPVVIAVGGGALLDPQSRRAALARARVVTLVADASTIERRTSGSDRPLLASLSDRGARIRELLADRAPAYAETHARIRTDERPFEETLRDVYQAWSEGALVVQLGARSYPVRFTHEPARAFAASITDRRPTGVFLVTDKNVDKAWGTTFTRSLAEHGVALRATVVLTPGEPNKRLAAVESILGDLIQAGADRGALVLAFGGGVVSDVAGFAASILFRGVPWIAVPTTLLAMVDAAIGGKTGVDLGLAKNAVGAFHQPRAVIIDPAFTSTETERAYRSGLAEAVKSACLGDPALFDDIERAPAAVLSRETLALRGLIMRAASVKIAIVNRDEGEAGDRALLNFGHTLGHALEAQGGFERLTHGEAVALGIVAMLRVGRELGVTPPALVSRVTALLDRLGLPVDLQSQPVRESLSLLALDKKRAGSSLRVVLLRAIGEPTLQMIDTHRLSDLVARASDAP